MNTNILVEAELARHDWSKIRIADGLATEIPSALRELLAAQTREECELAYWKLENYVVVQGQLFEAALFVVPVLMAALVTLERPVLVRHKLIELLFQIVNGYPDREEEARGLGDLDARCKDAARQGLWVLYREFLGENRKQVRYVIELLDEDKSRLESLEQQLI